MWSAEDTQQTSSCRVTNVPGPATRPSNRNYSKMGSFGILKAIKPPFKMFFWRRWELCTLLQCELYGKYFQNSSKLLWT